MKDHLKRNWKKYALAAAGAAGLYYGVPPGVSQAALEAFLATLGL